MRIEKTKVAVRNRGGEKQRDRREQVRKENVEPGKRKYKDAFVGDFTVAFLSIARGVIYIYIYIHRLPFFARIGNCGGSYEFIWNAWNRRERRCAPTRPVIPGIPRERENDSFIIRLLLPMAIF